MNKSISIIKFFAASALVAPLFFSNVSASPSEKNKRVIDHWTPERVKSATPRDFVIDNQGLGYIRRQDGSLIGHGHNKLTQLGSTPSRPSPMAKPGGGDNEGPTVSPIEPANAATIGASQRFAATITDASGIKSVSFVINFPSGSSQSFSASNSSGNVWETSLSGFTDGSGYSWHVVAKDNSQGRGNTTTSPDLTFSVDTGGGNPGGSHIVPNAAWTDGGLVLQTAGRLLYEMPTNRRGTKWSAFVCSGTVATDGISGRSIIITAAHCVFEDVSKSFARNVLFIPNQDGTTGSGTDTNCSNDPVGCWTPSFGVVDVNWTTRTFPDNIAWDYAYYVVNDSGAHSGSNSSSDALDAAVGSMNVSFQQPAIDDNDASASSPDFTHALGYSFSEDPSFMYCAEDMTTEGAVNWWLSSCDLSGGSSGGPWIQPMNTANGTGPLISVNSWGFTNSSGMAGPKLSGTSAECVLGEAETVSFNSVPTSDGDEGVAVNFCN